MLIIGAGVSAASFYHFLQQRLLSLPQHALSKLVFEVWEKTSNIGGRMLSLRKTDSNSVSFLHSDMGAQYITIQQNPSEFQYVYDYLVHKEVLILLDKTIEGTRSSHYTSIHYLAPLGTDRIVSTLFNHQATIFTNRMVVYLNLSEDGDYWDVKYKNSDANRDDLISTKHQHICLTIPSSALFQITGNWQTVVLNHFPKKKEEDNEEAERLLQGLKQVRYSSRYACAVFYSKDCRLELQASIPWMAKYIDDDDVIRYLSLESRKLNPTMILADDEECILIHTSVPYGINNEHTSEQLIKEQIMASLVRQLPQLKSYIPINMQLIYWKDSQVSSSSLPSIPLSCISIKIPGENKASISIIGDSFTESNFEGCLRSSNHAVNQLIDQFSSSTSSSSPSSIDLSCPANR